MAKLPPRESIRQFQQAKKELEQGNLTDAVRLFEEAANCWSDNAELWYLMGLANGRLNRLDEAKQASLNALELQPNHAGALYNLASAEFTMGHVKEALDHFRKLSNQMPGEISVIETYAKALMMVRQYQDAIDLLTESIARLPENANLHTLLGVVYSETANLNKALAEYETALKIDPDNLDGHLGASNIYKQAGDFRRAEKHYRDILKLNPNNENAYIGLAELNRISGFFVQALDYLDKSEQLASPTPLLLAKRMEILEQAGKHDEAYALIRQLIDTDQLTAISLMAYANLCHKFDACEEARALIDRFLELPGTTLPDKQNLNFAVGRMLDKSKRYDEAFSYYKHANDDQHMTFNSLPAVSFSEIMTDEMPSFDGAQETEYVDTVIKSFSRETMQQLPRSSVESSRPVFIVGMPRSGTSLTEQILAAHPQVLGAGELGFIGKIFSTIWKLQAAEGTGLIRKLHELGENGLSQHAHSYLEALAGMDQRAFFVTDKMPQNFQYLGLITLLFPRAHIIHCRRNPMDNALSIYFQQFSGFHRYATDLEDIGIYYRAYDRLMKHWESVIDIPIHTVHYEDMVENQKATSRAMLDYCGIDWDDAVMEFYRSPRAVTTASYDQVRQPLYKTSRERWRNYEAHLERLKQILLPEE